MAEITHQPVAAADSMMAATTATTIEESAFARPLDRSESVDKKKFEVQKAPVKGRFVKAVGNQRQDLSSA